MNKKNNQKIDSKWTKNLSAVAKSIKLLSKNIDINLYDPGSGNGFFDLMPTVQ